VTATRSSNIGSCTARSRSALRTKLAPSKTSSSWPQTWLRKMKGSPVSDHALHGEVDAEVLLRRLEGGAVDGDQDLRPALLQRLRHGGEPPILADHQAEPDAAEDAGAGRGAGGEDALVVEDAVVRQLMLGAAGHHLAAIEQEERVVQPAAVHPGAADDEARAAIGGLGGQRSIRGVQASTKAGLRTRSSGG
jgi:hypothetical protein